MGFRAPRRRENRPGRCIFRRSSSKGLPQIDGLVDVAGGVDPNRRSAVLDIDDAARDSRCARRYFPRRAPGRMRHLDRVAADGVEMVVRQKRHPSSAARYAANGSTARCRRCSEGGVAHSKSPTSLPRSRFRRSGCCARAVARAGILHRRIRDPDARRPADQNREIDDVGEMYVRDLDALHAIEQDSVVWIPHAKIVFRAAPSRAAGRASADCRRSEIPVIRRLRAPSMRHQDRAALKSAAAFKMVLDPAMFRSCAPGASVSSEEISTMPAGRWITPVGCASVARTRASRIRRARAQKQRTLKNAA